MYSKLRPYLLKILVAPADGICTPEIVPFSLYGNILPKYIVAFLKSLYFDGVITAVTYGVKMPRVGTQTISTLLLPPSLNEQQAYNGCRSILKLADSYSPRQLEEACEKTLKHLSLPRYKNIKLIIQYNQDTRQVNQEDENNDDFAFVRG
ncbi:hypothetical protein B5E79_06840, partial [Massilimicrobiota sp. An134]